MKPSLPFAVLTPLSGALLHLALTPAAAGAQTPAVGQVFKDCETGCPEMVVVPAGSFMMGSPSSEAGRGDNEGPVRRVAIPRPFAVGRYEVTYDEWDACIRDGGCEPAGGLVANDQGWGRGRRPVIEVNQDSAEAFTAWLSARTGKGYRLLTEAEWEYSARAGTSTPYSTGDTITTEQANFGSTWEGNTREVGAYPPNAFGLHDMHGNVDEWAGGCGARQASEDVGPGDRSISQACAPILRGGGWNSYEGGLRSAYRNPMVAGYSHDSSGFRVAREL